MKTLAAKIRHILEDVYTDTAWDGVERYSADVRDGTIASFLGPQIHLATECCGTMEPVDRAGYREHDGFVALERCIKSMRQQDIIDEITKSGLRGRGGGGFPTGIKWSFVQKAPGERKFVLCNGDEGDPGAFMDRMLLESYPFRIIEGMIIAAYAVGAHEGYFYIRAEYPLALKRIREALAVLESEGLLGENIAGSGFSLKLNIMEGAGAFVCGEETALIESIEGKRGMPRIRPPFPAHKGLWGVPTLVNNVETYSLVPWIMRNGASAFAAIGTEKSKGTKVFALAGKIARGGLIEVPMGISLRRIVEDIGGGIAGGKKLKAIQVGGPSGGCIPAQLADMPVEYEQLTMAGAMMGSGGMVVLDETDCMVDIARYFLTFTQDQSCGKCTFCRIGTRRMLDILENLCKGKGKEGDIERLEDLAKKVRESSLCGLGKTAPNPVISTIRYFREEYEAHIQGWCPAKKCPDLVQYRITDNCIGCTRCAQRCPTGAIEFKPYEKHVVIDEKCTRCATCLQVCPTHAIEVVRRG
jgi:NADH-quinone oxidoreductase subunit F